ncbi:MAG: hypothetical protein Q8P68_06455 [Candidatus Peregrinibacteria bacterium]|nr:hypothetical protein [Candidatus Peregrinibacteria bacterium]MDZ4244435.1 hypothetical protein [Candidatus Gracilibacteria bacterium]
MNFSDETNRKQLKQNELYENWENPDIEALLDMRALRLLTKQEVIDKLTAMKIYFEKRIEVLSDSRTNIMDFINRMTEGSSIEQKLAYVMENLEEMRKKMYAEERDGSYDKYKDNFDTLLRDILGRKADLQNLALEKFIEKSPPYLDRVMKKARQNGDKDKLALLGEAKEVKRSKSKEEVKNTLVWISGDENDMSPTEYKSFDDNLQSKAESALENWLSGKIDEDDFNAKFGDLLDDARERGGEKAVLKLRLLRNKYRVRRENYELSELVQIHSIFGEEGENVKNSSGLLFSTIRYVQDGLRYGSYSKTEAASELWGGLATLTEQASSQIDFNLGNGELKHLQDFIGGLRSRFDSDDVDFEGMISECAAYRDGLPMRDERHKDARSRYEKSLAEGKADFRKAAHNGLIYGFIYKDLTEKDSAREVLTKMKGEMKDAMKIIKEDFDSGDLEKMKDASYTLDRTDEFLTVVSSVDLSTQLMSASKLELRNKEAKGAESIDHLLGAFNAFEGHEMEAEDVIAKIKQVNPEMASKIEERIAQVDDDVRFVDRESFDKFFDGKTQDDFRGLSGAFYQGTIFIVYTPGDLERGDNLKYLERTYKVLTHESIHHTMHDEVSDETGRFLNTLLYGSSTYSENGLNLARSGNTLGAQIIKQFMTDRGNEFEDFVQKRTKIKQIRKSNDKLTFNEVIRNEDVSKEILEEAMTVYLTYIAINGPQQLMRPPYLDYLRRFHETDQGKEIFSKFTPGANNEEVVSLGADTDASESGISAGKGGEASEIKQEVPPKNLEDLLKFIEAVEVGTIGQVQKLLKQLYNVEDYEGILASAKDDLEYLRSEVGKLALEEARNGEEASNATRKSIDKNIEAIKKNLEENMLAKLEDEKKLRDKEPEDELSYIERLWSSTTFVSMDDVIKVFQDGWAYLKERRELRRDRVAAAIGTSISPTERMSNYFEGLGQSVQNRDISKWKEIYTDKDPNSLNAILDRASDINQVKALFEIKADTYGDFFFRSKQTKLALGRVSGKKIDTYYQAKDIFDDLYGRGEADGLERKNSGSRKGKVSESEEMGKQHADDLEIEWMKMIAAMQADPPKWVDSAKFEGFIHYALTAGKSYLRAVIWMITKGFTLGILDYKTIVEMGGSALVKNAPHIEYLGDIIKDHDRGIPYAGGEKGQTEIEFIASLDLFDPEGQETRGSKSTQTAKQLDDWVKYEKWLLYTADRSARVQQRYGKIKSSSDGLDHDYVQDMWWEFNRGSYQSILNERTGAVQFIQDQGIANVYGQFITNSLYWTDEDLMSKYDKWFKTDRLLVEEDFDNDGSKFTLKQNQKQKATNRTTLDDDKLDEVGGAMYKNTPMKYFRNLTYFAWKESKGDMKIARDIMMAGALDLGISWVPKASIQHYYTANASNGWDYANVTAWRARIDPRTIPEAPQSHFYDYLPPGAPPGTQLSMEKDLNGYPPGFK